MNTLEKISQQFSNEILDSHAQHGDETVLIRKEAILPVLEFLKTDPELDFNMLTDLTAVDCFWLKRKHRFEVVYHLYSLAKKHRIRVKVPVSEKDPVVNSATPLWPIADWFEREVWDMFGIRFEGHPNLKRLLMYEEFSGHALRKDYPYNKRQPLIGPKN